MREAQEKSFGHKFFHIYIYIYTKFPSDASEPARVEIFVSAPRRRQGDPKRRSRPNLAPKFSQNVVPRPTWPHRGDQNAVPGPTWPRRGDQNVVPGPTSPRRPLNFIDFLEGKRYFSQNAVPGPTWPHRGDRSAIPGPTWSCQAARNAIPGLT